MKKRIENLIVALARSLYSKPRLTPKVSIFEKGSKLAIEIDVSPYNPGLLIGERGSMKFAVQLLVGYALDRDPERGVDVVIASSKTVEIERTPPKPADGAKIKPVCQAVAALLGGTVSIEAAETCAMAKFELPREFVRDVKPPLSKIVRACGKAAGFSALPYVSPKHEGRRSARA